MKNAIVKMGTLAATLAFATVGTGCKSTADKIVEAFQNDATYGAYSWSVAKDKTLRNNYVVLKVVVGGTPQYLAMNMTGFADGMTGSQYVTYLTSTPGAVDYVSPQVQPDGTVTGFYNGSSGFLYESANVGSKDLEKAAAMAEGAAISLTAENLASQYGLSEERSVELAKLSNRFSKIQKSRAVSPADLDALTQEAAGVSLAEIEQAKSNPAMASDLIERAAVQNDTSVENMRAIVGSILQ